MSGGKKGCYNGYNQSQTLEELISSDISQYIEEFSGQHGNTAPQKWMVQLACNPWELACNNAIFDYLLGVPPSNSRYCLILAAIRQYSYQFQQVPDHKLGSYTPKDIDILVHKSINSFAGHTCFPSPKNAQKTARRSSRESDQKGWIRAQSMNEPLHSYNYR